MRARRFNKRIELWQTESEADGFGGNTLKTELITITWAEIKALNKYINTDSFGISNTQLAVHVTVRLRKDLTYNSINQFIKYANESYTISSFPENKNFDNAFISFIAVKQDTKTVPTIAPIP